MTLQQVEVIDDPQQIARVRLAYEAELDRRFSAAMERIRSGKDADLLELDCLERRSDRIAEPLNRIVDDQSALPMARAVAAATLAALNHAKGEEFLIAALDPNSPEACAAAVKALDNWRYKRIVARPQIAERILALIAVSNDSQVLKTVLHLCRWRDLPGAEAALIRARSRQWPSAKKPDGEDPIPAVVARLDDPFRQAFADALVHLTRDPSSVMMMIPYLFRKRDKKYTHSMRNAYRRLFDLPDPLVSKIFKGRMKSYLLQYEGDDRLGQHWAGDFATVAEPEDVAILEDIVARATDPVSRAYAIRGLARLAPETAVSRVLTEFRRERAWWSELIELLAEYAAEADYDRVACVLYSSAEEAKKRQFGMNDAQLLFNKFGERGRQFIQSNRDRFGAFANQWLTWRLEGLDVRGAIAELHGVGIVHMMPEEIIDRLHTFREENGRTWDPADPTLFESAIGVAGITVGFDTETGTIPCRHDNLILSFARASGNRFTPESPFQTWHREHGKDYKAPYIVEFVYQGRLYRFAAANYGDYYDVGAVVKALNVALETAGQPERYIDLHTGDQCARFVFADPATFIPIARKYGIALSEDPSAAMKAGRAFEQAVANALKK